MQLLQSIRRDIDQADLSMYGYLFPKCKNSKQLRQNLQTQLYRAYGSDSMLPYSYIPSHLENTTQSVQLGHMLLHSKQHRNYLYINNLKLPFEKHPPQPFSLPQFTVTSPSPLTVIHVEGKEKKENNSFFNLEELQCVCDTVTYIQRKHPGLSIAVLSLYKPQVTKQTDKLPSNVVVSTIDGFQGQEADVVVISTVRSNAQGSLGFTQDKNRCNVAISRAKNNMLFICNVDTYSIKPNPWSIQLKTAQDLQCVHTQEEQNVFYNNN